MIPIEKEKKIKPLLPWSSAIEYNKFNKCCSSFTFTLTVPEFVLEEGFDFFFG